ncbi:39S ribosomal protein L47, mitochondrial [Drosophila guanche]|uniref:Large ribosomal subunit protein uL29m n=1 Tax=Drosophila guanche TaxID=7266 RepID=A0A3B0JQV5_DROGU|nr:39S ribosomal protein L47, mitochondrial [Drosophila guanche]SPP84557.1 blast:39S ribosomal protein L47%2C mitochondrial [Drosophila guanche]
MSATLIKVLNLAKTVRTSTIKSLLTAPKQQWQSLCAAALQTPHAQMVHTSPMRHGLMEFFDDPKHWSENDVKVGRAWRTEELRIKSNKELHQLWFVLLKERNMLLTMEHECNDKMEIFPSPERVDKVKISMDNLEKVVRERNTAYHLLETGETGERPQKRVNNSFGLQFNYKSCEHVLPPFMNLKWIKSRNIGFGGRAVNRFLLKYREQLYNAKRKAKNRSRNEVMMILRRNPNFDLGVLRRKFPDVDIDKLRSADKARGHYVPKIGV